MFFAAGRQTFLKNKNSSGLAFFMEPSGGADFREKGEAALRWGIIQWDVQRRMEENLHQVEHGLQTTALDVAVLPEMCLCGYLFQDAAHLAQAARGGAPLSGSAGSPLPAV